MITIIIPTKNRLRKLKECLLCISNQNQLEALEEILIVDDYSTPKYIKEIVTYCQELQIPARMMENELKHGAVYARNQAIQHAKGEIIAFLDDDSLPAEDWLGVILQHFKTGKKAITGRIEAVETKNIFSRARQLRYDIRRDNTMQGKKDDVNYFAGGNGAIDRSLLQAVDGFNTDFLLMHDRELIFKINNLGVTCSYVDDMLIKHYHHKGVYRAFERALTSGKLRKQMEIKHPEFVSPWHLRELINSYKSLIRKCSASTYNIIPALVAGTLELFHVIGYNHQKIRIKYFPKSN